MAGANVTPLCIHLETTGVSYEDQVIQISVVQNDVEIFLRCIMPTVLIQPKASEVNGMQLFRNSNGVVGLYQHGNDISRRCVNRKLAWNDFFNFVLSYPNPLLIGQNMTSFLKKFIVKEAVAVGLQARVKELEAAAIFVCSLGVFRTALPHLTCHTLDHLALPLRSGASRALLLRDLLNKTGVTFEQLQQHQV